MQQSAASAKAVKASKKPNRVQDMASLSRHRPRRVKPILQYEYDPEFLSRIQPLPDLPIEAAILHPIKGAAPQIVMLSPETDLWVDRNYQRGLESADVRQIISIYENWDWAKFKVPNGFWLPEHGGVRLTDGQKTATAALYRQIAHIPVSVQNAGASPEMDLVRQADAFVGINSSQRKIPPHELFKALLVVGDEQERQVAAIIAKYGVNLVAAQKGKFEPMDCTCVNVLRNVCKRDGADTFDWVMDVCSRVRYKPIRRDHIAALAHVATVKAISEMSPDRMMHAIRSISDREALLEAKDKVRRNNRPSYNIARALGEIYLSRYSEKKRALNSNE